MKRVLILFFCVLIFIAPGQSKAEQLANTDKQGLYAKSIERVLRLDEDEIDLATAVLMISEQWNDNVYGRKYLSRLDDMSYELLSILKDKKTPLNHRAIAVINEYLFKEMGFSSVDEATNPNDLFLHSVLDKKRGYCLSLSVLYLSIAERLGLPLYGVVVPGHFFVRYDDGQVRFNIETTSNGGYSTDENYIEEFNVPEDGDESLYMSNLNKLQTLGCFFNNLGNSYDEVGNTDSAKMALERAVEINPGLAESHLNLGNVYLKLGRTQNAITQYKRAIEINPNESKAHNNLGNAYLKIQWFDYAIVEYETALELDPDFTDVYTNLASAYFKIENFQQAIWYLKKAITLEPKNSDFYNQLGNVYYRDSQYEKAIEQFKRALKIKPGIAEAYYGLGICYNKFGDTNTEISYYKKAIAIKGDMSEALSNLGSAYFGKKNYDLAIEYYKKAIAVNPDDSGSHYNLGSCYFNKSLYEDSVSSYLKAVEFDSSMGQAYNGLAGAYYYLEEYGLALENLQKAEQLGIEIDGVLLAAIEDRLKN